MPRSCLRNYNVPALPVRSEYPRGHRSRFTTVAPENQRPRFWPPNALENRLAEFDFEFAYRKCSKHDQPNVLSRLYSDGHTTEHEGLDIPCINLTKNPTGTEEKLSKQPPSKNLIQPVSVENILVSQSEDPTCRQVFQDIERSNTVLF